MSYVSGGTYHVNGSIGAGNTPGSSSGVAYTHTIISAGGVVSNGSVTQGGVIEVVSGGTLVNQRIASGGTLIVSGGWAKPVYTDPGASVIINSGSIWGGGQVQSGGTFTVNPGATLNSNTVNSGGSLILNGGTTSDITLRDGASLTVNSGASWDGMPPDKKGIKSGGTLTVGSGGTITNQTISSGGVLVVNEGFASNISMQPGASLMVNSGVTWRGGQVQSGGILTVNPGAVITSHTVGVGGSMIVNGGATSDVTLLTSASVTVNSGASWDGLPPGKKGIKSGGTLTVEAGGRVTNQTVSAGGELVLKGGVASNTILQPGANVTLSSGASWDGSATGDMSVKSGGTLTLNAGATLSKETISSGGTLVINEGVATDIGQEPGATVVVNGGPAWKSGRILNEAQTIINAGGTLADVTVASGGKLTVNGGKIQKGSIESGGKASLLNGSTLSGTIDVSNGGHLTIPTDAGGVVNLQGNTDTGLSISGLSGGGTLTTVINGFSGSGPGKSDTIAILGLKPSDVASVTYPTVDSAALRLTNGKTIVMYITGIKKTGYSLKSASDGTLVMEVCFLPGTMIRTKLGDVAVEDLQIGDEIAVFDRVSDEDGFRPMVWLGSKTAVVRPYLRDDEAGYPVRVKKDALADGCPHKDLLLTPEHSLFLQGHFVPVRMLVNGRSILFDKSISSYQYYHVETDQHSIIMADGVLTESYLDTGNRRSFVQTGAVLAMRPSAPKTWDAHASAPLNVSRAFVEPIFEQLVARAKEKAMGWIPEKPLLTDESGLHLETMGGKEIAAFRQANGRLLFRLPDAIDTVRIRSNSSRPSDVIGPFVDDRRQLGVLLGEITLFESSVTTLVDGHLSKAELEGWNAQELTPCRWTDGDAVLPLGKRVSGSLAILALELKAAGPYLVESDDDRRVRLEA